MSEAVNIPQLRFPEFNGAWEEKKLGEVVRYTKGFAFKSNDYVDSGVRIIRVSDLGAESIKKDNKSIYLSSENEHLYDKWKIRKNNIVITTVGSNPDLIESAVGRGIFIINDNEGLLNQNMLKLENNTQVNNKFVHCFINSPKYIHHIKAIKRGNANQANITVKELLDFKLSITTKPEQQKIAAFLTSVDNKIEQLSKKKELLGEYKKGLMQQIFSQAIRFKADDGCDFPDWEEKKLGDIGHTFNGLTGKTKDDFGRGKPYIQYMQIFESSKINIDNFGLVDVRDDENQKVAQYGDVFFTTSSETPDAVGYSSVLLDDIDKLYLNSFCFGFRPNSLDELSPNFAQFLLRSANFRRRVVRLAQGSTRYNMSKVQLMKEVISLPCLKEQTKIANFLSSIDTKIEQVGKQLDGSKQFKKALLQQMFV